MYQNSSPYRDEYTVIGVCEECCGELRADYDYYVDADGNKFCSEECGISFHGLKKCWN